MQSELKPQEIASWNSEFDSVAGNRVLQNAVCRAGIAAVSMNHRALVEDGPFCFGTGLDAKWSVTSQRSTGRCWIFAGLNTLRYAAMQTLGVSDFEFSQAFVFFFSKLERANYFLKAIIDTRDLPDGDRTLDYLLEHPIDDGGQWDLFAGLVSKHGLVPKAAFPETDSCERSAPMNGILREVLRDAALRIRTGHRTGKLGVDALDAVRGETVKKVHRVLCLHLGSPPEKFSWRWAPKGGEIRRVEGMTPLEFMKLSLGGNDVAGLCDFISVVHDPRATSPPMRTFTVEFLGTIVGAPCVKYLNVASADTLMQLAVKQVGNQMGVWFGADSGKSTDKKEAIFDDSLYEIDQVLGFKRSSLTKSDRLVYHGTLMTHAMTFVAAEVVGGVPVAWKVENSWGEKDIGHKGFYIMTKGWFAENVFEVAIHRKFLPPEFIEAFQQEPIKLPAWDPMGALAH